MEITEVKVFPIQEEKLKAFVSIVFDQCFMVNDIKIIQGRDGLFISMPSRKKKNGEFKDVAHPLNNETRRMIEDKVLGEYERVLAERGEQLPAPPHHLAESAATAAVPAAASAGSAAPGALVTPVDVRAVPAPPPVMAAAFRALDAADAAGPAAAPGSPAGHEGAEAGDGAGAATAQAAPSPAKPPEKTMEEIEEMHLRDSFWTVT
jgi:stage V sporulation protein G